MAELLPQNEQLVQTPTAGEVPFKSVQERQAAGEKIEDPADKAMLLLKLSPEDQQSYLKSTNFTTLQNKMAEIQTEYNSRVEKMGEQRATASMIGLISHLALGIYGVEHGVDTSGVKFDQYDWAAEYQKIMDRYRINNTIAQSLYEAKASQEQRVRSGVERMIEMQERQKEREEDKKTAAGAKAQAQADSDFAKRYELHRNMLKDADSNANTLSDDARSALAGKKTWDSIDTVAGRLNFPKFKDWIDANKAIIKEKYNEWHLSDSEEKEYYVAALSDSIAAQRNEKVAEAKALVPEVYEKTKDVKPTKRPISRAILQKKYPTDWQKKEEEAKSQGYEIIP